MEKIKSLKPSKKSVFEQGYIDPSKCKKLFNDLNNQPIIYRSSYEKKFIEWLENNDNIIKWGSECVGIKYFYKNKPHTYYPDFIIQNIYGETIIIEIKPHYQTQKPPLKSNIKAFDCFSKNLHKWKAAKKWCEERGMKFKIITEKLLNNL